MERAGTRCLIISSFNADVFAGYLANAGDGRPVEATTAPFGQVVPILAAPNHEVWAAQPDAVIVWTQPQSVIPLFGAALDMQPVADDELLAQVDQFCHLALQAAERARWVFVPTWTLPAYQRGLGLLDLRPGVGLTQRVLRMNLRLAETLAQANNVYVLDAARWNQLAGENAFNPKLWAMAKVPFGNPVFKAAAVDVRAALDALSGQSRKLIVLDLDDTLWAGIVGDVGWEGLTLGGHDPVGEALVAFQRALKALSRRGVLLALVSKNDENVALEAIRQHPEMILRLDDFVGWRINWQDKAANIASLTAALNLGLQSVVFIDDNPTERGRVRETLPEVLVPEWPADKLLYEKALHALTCFDTPTITHEDLNRTRLYADEQARARLKAIVGSLEEWLATLDITVTVEALDQSNLPRAAQLLNKTNQMNLTTRRLAEAELWDWAHTPGHQVWTVRVADRFGDLGLTGLVSLATEGGRGRVVDFLLSCRAMGRRVEQTMLHIAIEHARAVGLASVDLILVPTAKNAPCLRFLEESGLGREGEYQFSWSGLETYPKPEFIRLENPLLQCETA